MKHVVSLGTHLRTDADEVVEVILLVSQERVQERVDVVGEPRNAAWNIPGRNCGVSVGRRSRVVVRSIWCFGFGATLPHDGVGVPTEGGFRVATSRDAATLRGSCKSAWLTIADSLALQTTEEIVKEILSGVSCTGGLKSEARGAS